MSKLIKSFQNEKQNHLQSKKIDVESVFGIMKPILSFTRKSVRGINKDKRELGLVLMTLNIRKVPAQRAENYKNHKKDNFILFQ